MQSASKSWGRGEGRGARGAEIPFRDQHGQLFLYRISLALCAGGCVARRQRHTNVDVGLVTSEGCVVPDAVHVSAGALHTKRILDGVDAALVLEDAAGCAQEGSGKGGHVVLSKDGVRRYSAWQNGTRAIGRGGGGRGGLSSGEAVQIFR